MTIGNSEGLAPKTPNTKQEKKSFLSPEMRKNLEEELDGMINRLYYVSPEHESKYIREEYGGDRKAWTDYLENEKAKHRASYNERDEMDKIAIVTNNFWRNFPGRGRCYAEMTDNTNLGHQLCMDIRKSVEELSEEDRKILGSMVNLRDYPDDEAKHKWYAVMFPIFYDLKKKRTEEGWTREQMHDYFYS